MTYVKKMNLSLLVYIYENYIKPIHITYLDVFVSYFDVSIQFAFCEK